MATVDWGDTKVISVPKSDMTLVQTVPYEIRELDIQTFRLELRDLEAGEDEGRPWGTTHNHNTEVTVSGTTLARVVFILAPYTITFEDGQYAVNIVGGNSNISDVVNLNQVSVRSNNSAGLTAAPKIDEMWQDMGLDPDRPKTITENEEGTSYDEESGATSTLIRKLVRKLGTITTITRQ